VKFQNFVKIKKGKARNGTCRSNARNGRASENPNAKNAGSVESVEIFLDSGNLYHASIRQTGAQLPNPFNCVQMTAHYGKPFALRASGVVLLGISFFHY